MKTSDLLRTIPPAARDESGRGAVPQPPVRIHVRLKDGTDVVLQPLRPEDREQLLEGYGRLSAHSRRMRFLHPMGLMPEALLDRLMAIDAQRHFAWTARDSAGQGIGVARYIRPEPGDLSAEMAVTIMDGVQGHGLGAVLLGMILRSATAHGVETFTGLVLAENQAMRHLIADLGGHFTFESGSGDALSFEMPVPALAEDLPDTSTGRVVVALYRALPEWPPADGTRIEISRI